MEIFIEKNYIEYKAYVYLIEGDGSITLDENGVSKLNRTEDGCEKNHKPFLTMDMKLFDKFSKLFCEEIDINKDEMTKKEIELKYSRESKEDLKDIIEMLIKK